MDRFQSAPQIIEYFQGWDIDEDAKMYLQYHCRRYILLIELTAKIIAKIRHTNREEPIKILDIGPSFQTILLQKIYSEAYINTMGYKDSRFRNRRSDQHHQFDLNDAQYPEKWQKIEQHDIIIMAEIIEHLYTSPALVLSCILPSLKSDGFFIIQTPNACALEKRLKMLMGKNPYEPIRESRQNPGHFREYTLDEMIGIGKNAGLETVEYTISNYFNDERKINKVCRCLSTILPVRYREGITISFKKRAE